MYTTTKKTGHQTDHFTIVLARCLYIVQGRHYAPLHCELQSEEENPYNIRQMNSMQYRLYLHGPALPLFARQYQLLMHGDISQDG